MSIKKGQTVEVEITNMAFGGRGIAKMDGFTIFVDQAVAGDVAAVRITRRKKSYAEAVVKELLRASPNRVQARCPYSGLCGGCKWQFLDYRRQLYYKREHVREALAHIGGVTGCLIHDTIPSSKIFEYRNKMEFSCSDRRWLLPHEMHQAQVKRDFALGLHVPGTFYKVIDTQACLLQPNLGNQILEHIRQYIKNSELPVYGLRSHEGFWRFVMLRHSFAYNQWMVNIITATENRDQMIPLAVQLVEDYPEVISIINNVTARKAGIAVGEYEVLLAGADHLKDAIADFEFVISANSFFQTNTDGAGILYNQAKKFADLQGTETVLDLYSGTGTIAIFLSDSARKVIGIEQVESAVKDAERNCRVNGISNCEFIQGEVEACLPGIDVKPDVMIIDPPRTGMHKDVVKQVLALAPQRIVYVSCNPSTLARDIGMIKEHYRLTAVQPVDLFPHTYHIESVARLDKR